MDDYLDINYCARKSNVYSFIKIVLNSMTLLEKVFVCISLVFSAFIFFILNFGFLDLFFGDYEGNKNYLSSLILLVALGLLYSAIRICEKCTKRRFGSCLDVLDGKVKDKFFRLRFYKFLIFIKECDEKNILNDWQIEGALNFCKEELKTYNYSNISSHPFFVIYSASLPATIVLLLDKFEPAIPYWTFLIFFTVPFVYLHLKDKINVLDDFNNTKFFCQWTKCFKQSELEFFAEKMKGK